MLSKIQLLLHFKQRDIVHMSSLTETENNWIQLKLILSQNYWFIFNRCSWESALFSGHSVRSSRVLSQAIGNSPFFDSVLGLGELRLLRLRLILLRIDRCLSNTDQDSGHPKWWYVSSLTMSLSFQSIQSGRMHALCHEFNCWLLCGELAWGCTWGLQLGHLYRLLNVICCRELHHSGKH
jgi:hypothetical protein